MSIWNKILIGFIFIAACGFIYQAAVVLKIHQAWRESVRAHEEKVAEVEAQNEKLLGATGNESDDAQRGLKYVKLALHELRAGRGRVWPNCERKQTDRATGKMAIVTDTPGAPGIVLNDVLYVFEEADIRDGGRYLGEFKVIGVDEAGPDVVLQPTEPLSAELLERLSKSAGTLILYEQMPADSHDAFSDFTEEELREILPADCVAEYIKDGKPAEEADTIPDPELNLDPETIDNQDPFDPYDRVVDGKYVRKLVDFTRSFEDARRQIAVSRELYASLLKDKALLESALEKAQAEVKFRETEKAKLVAQHKAYVRESKALADHGKKLADKIAAIDTTIRRVIAQNYAMGAEMAKIQLAARDAIEARMRRLADVSGTE